MFELGFTFPLKGFISDMFFHYNIYISQLHLNGEVLFKASEEYFTIIANCKII
jgi:hypothetical protein